MDWCDLFCDLVHPCQLYVTQYLSVDEPVADYVLVIVLNMFIAVIQENFDMTEDEKRLQQIKAFLQRKELGPSTHG